MFRLGIIEESLEHTGTLDLVRPYFFSQRVEHVPEDECPVWHTNEYRVPDGKIVEVLDVLKDEVKPTWYIHAFSDSRLFVVLRGRCFAVSPHRDKTWDDMIEYGVKTAEVERRFLENVPLHI